MAEKLNSVIAVIGIDIGKNSFHVVGLDKRGAIVLRRNGRGAKWKHGLPTWPYLCPQVGT
jgi:transposase